MRLINRQLPILLLLLLVALASCGSPDPTADQAAQFSTGLVPPIPAGDRQAAAVSVVPGASPLDFGDGTTVESTALRIDASTTGVSWALYGFAAPDPPGLNSLALTVADVNNEYWVGLADYGVTNTWQWFGPYADNAQIDFGPDSDRYLSAANNLYWVVVAEGTASILLIESSVDFDFDALEFRIPPPGLQVADTGPALTPSLVLMPEIEGLADQGAPVIFYTAPGDPVASVRFAFYNGYSWDTRRFNPGGLALSFPAALWRDGSGAVIAYDHTAGPLSNGQLVLYNCNQDWSVDSDEELSAPLGLPLKALKADYNPDTGDYAIIHAYDTSPADVIQMHVGHLPAGWVSMTPILAGGQKVAGADIEFNPATGLPEAVYSHGTYDYTDTVILDFIFEYGRFNGSSWNITPADYNAPQTIDLNFMADGTPRAVMVAARDYSITWPISLTATLYYDIVLGTYNGAGWDYSPLFESTIDLLPFQFQIDLNLGIDCAWAASDQLVYTGSEGSVEYELIPEFAITGGSLANDLHYLQDDGGGFSPSSYFDPAQAGYGFSWQEGPSGPVCAYIRSDGLDVDALLGGNPDLASDLYYWSP